VGREVRERISREIDVTKVLQIEEEGGNGGNVVATEIDILEVAKVSENVGDFLGRDIREIHTLDAVGV